jgi:hypothetical protein
VFSKGRIWTENFVPKEVSSSSGSEISSSFLHEYRKSIIIPKKSKVITGDGFVIVIRF